MCARRSSAAGLVTGGSGRQEPAEPGQVAGDRLHRGRGAGGAGLGAVVEQQPAQRFGDPAVVPAQAGAAPRIGRWPGQDAEVEQHPMRRADQAAIVGPPASRVNASVRVVTSSQVV